MKSFRQVLGIDISGYHSEVKQLPHAQRAKHRDQTAREMFAKLTVEERAQWTEQAKEEHEEALEVWKGETSGEVSTTPEDRQR